MKNVTKNKKDKTFTVCTPDGKTKTYIREAAALAYAVKSEVSITIPSVVVANTYFWRPQGSAGGRRANEKRHNATMERFIARLVNVPMELDCDYSESCNNVYKSFTVHKPNGKKSNITGLKSAAEKIGIILVD